MAFKYEGASLATFKHPCNILSGMISISGSGGGSDEMKTLKLGWVLGLAFTLSRKPSKPYKPYSQDYIKCTFYNITQCPFLAPSNTAFLAPSS